MKPHLAVLLAIVSIGATEASRPADKTPSDKAHGSKAEPGEAKFKIAAKRKDDRVEVRAEKGKVLFDVHSPFGISQAVVERQGDAWPERVSLRLHLKGMEQFRASHGKLRLEAALSVEGVLTQQVFEDGKEAATLNEKSRFWMDVRVLGEDGKQAKGPPPKNGFIEVTLPAAFFEGNPRSITLNWVDFFRN